MQIKNLEHHNLIEDVSKTFVSSQIVPKEWFIVLEMNFRNGMNSNVDLTWFSSYKLW